MRVFGNLLFYACSGAALCGSAIDTLQPRHAENFEIRYTEDAKEIIVRNPWTGSGDTAFTYRLPYERDEEESADPGDPALTRTLNPERAVVTSTTFLPHFVALGLLEHLAGVADFRDINSPEIRSLIEAGDLQETGRDPAMNTEVVMALEPDVIFASTLGNTADGALPKLAKRGLPVVVTAAYMEPTPLGRAEWIKFIAAFFDKEAEAEAIFNGIEERYTSLAALTESALEEPTVFFNVPWGGTWYLPGGEGYLAKLTADAGARYLWADQPGSGSFPVDFEEIYLRASDADFWLHTGSASSLDELMALDARYGRFAAVHEGQVYHYDRRVNEYGGNDLWERGALYPDEVLADLIRIFHPELLPDHEFVFYRALP